MKLNKFWDAFDKFSAQASEQARQLSYAGIAVVWIFAVSDQDTTSLPKPLLIPVLMFVLSLGLDLAQYLYGSIAWYLFCRGVERSVGTTPEPEVDAPARINYLTNILFASKLFCVFFGLAWLLVFLIFRIQAA